jgi:hypothetical protein
LATANLPCVQGSDGEFCPYSGDIGDQFLANSDSSGTTYNVNIWGLYGPPAAEGFEALGGALKAEAAQAGAESISILGTHIMNPAVMRIGIIAGRFGLSTEVINATTILLRGALMVP